MTSVALDAPLQFIKGVGPRKAEALASGRDLIDFGVGDPREITAPLIREALGAAIEPISSYPRAAGLPELRGAISGWLERRFQVTVDAESETATLAFADADHASLAYTVNGVSQVKALQRQRFSAQTTCMQTRATRAHTTNYQDLWWNSAESGWGINLAHQGDTLFATWFTYGAAGRGAWFVGPDVRRQPMGEFRGRLYRTSGRPFDRIAGAPAVVGDPVDVGEVAFTFADGEQGRFDYTVDGVRQSKAITRQRFGAGAPICR